MARSTSIQSSSNQHTGINILACCPWMNLDGADKGLNQKHRRHIHKSDLLIISCSLFQSLHSNKRLVALVLLHSKSTLAPSSYQVFKSSNLHLNKSQSLHTCKQSRRNPMMTMNNIFHILYLREKKTERVSDYISNKCNSNRNSKIE